MKITHLFYLQILAILVFVPHLAFAGIRISEIMYDPSGSDTNHEWVEIENDGDSPVDISGWKFFENNSNHSIVSVAGSMILPAHGFAIIAENATTFQADYLQFSGTLLDSVFSLSNSGETISLKNGEGNIVNEVSYTSSQGSNGDGNSLIGSLTEWIVGLPTPGATNQKQVVESSSSTQSSASQNNDNENSVSENNGNDDIANSGQSSNDQPGGNSDSKARLKAKPKKKISAKIVTPKTTILSDADTVFNAIITNEEGEPTQVGNIFWNFGDGESVASQNTNPVAHVYGYPGRYVVTVEYYESFYDREPKASDRATIIVSMPQIEFDDDGLALSLKNKGKSEIDISRWQILTENSSYIFPRGSVLLSGSFIILEKKKAGLMETGQYSLRFPNFRLILVAKDILLEVVEKAPLPIVSAQDKKEVTTTETAPYSSMASTSANVSVAMPADTLHEQTLFEPISESTQLSQVAESQTVEEGSKDIAKESKNTIYKKIPKQVWILVGIVFISSFLGIALSRLHKN